MKRKFPLIPTLIALGICLGSVSQSVAQKPSGIPKFRPQIHIDLFTPQGAPLTQHDDHYHYVVPPTPRQGAFYTHENKYYYTPAAPRGPGRPRAPQPIVMEFGASKHLVELAERIEFTANELCLDLHYNYRHNRGFDQIYREAYQLLDGAKFIHDRGHQGDRDAIRRTIKKIDDLFHHVQEEVTTLKRDEHRRVGRHGVEAKTEELQALIHHLMYDQGVKPHHDNDHDHDRGRDAPPPREEAPRPR